jgi:hypothetical protein
MPEYKIEYTSELPHQQRVVVEANELGVKIVALNEFIINNPFFQKIDVEEKSRLMTQYGYMQSYFQILKERIENF